MTQQQSAQPLPPFYATTIRILVRYAIAMGIFGLLIGVAFQESAKKLPLSAMPGGLHLEAIMPLALVHGHVFMLGVLMPLAMAGALLLALKSGGRPLGKTSQTWLTLGFLPFAALTIALQLFKGYFILLAVRHGQHDMAAVDAAFLGGSAVLRFALYAVIHSGMGVTLGVFLIGLWRSLDSRS